MATKVGINGFGHRKTRGIPLTIDINGTLTI